MYKTALRHTSKGSQQCFFLAIIESVKFEHFKFVFLGAHVNPAVSLGLLTLRKLKVIQCLFYIVGQIGGAFFASALVYLVYLSHFNQYDGGIRQIEGSNGTADIFYTVPGVGIPNWNCFIDSMVGTSVLLIFIMALGNDYNHLISNAAKPFAFVLMFTTFGFSMSLNCGNPINPVSEVLFSSY
jgi:glycerol uptake facilitator-like aquaporin